MILQSGTQQQISNLVTLIGTEGLSSARSLKSLRDLQAGYRCFIERTQRRHPAGAVGTTRIVTDPDEANRFRPLFVNDSLLDDKAQSIVIEKSEDPEAPEKHALLERALQELALYSPEHRVLFDTVVTDVFILPSGIAKAGSTSAALGVIWANPRIHHTLHDVIELLVHELTHQTMFIDELTHSHYDYQLIVERSTWATSAILHVPRPLDKVLHSAVVATEILLLRQELLGHPVRPSIHPPTPALHRQVCESIASMEAVTRKPTSDRVFQDRACEILENLREISERLSTGSTVNKTH
ncbi:aKG-HExxH-type peptide beta-hydroxylase [Cupriavidus necator]|uniref:aKG-HExxH-type peptide beta-hydroxylase n=1 Tax=Cupriavidus necator TaxID=106590 RepID=UPI00339D93E7